jgi:hypothetical protein
MITEYRIVITATFTGQAERDAAYTALRGQVASYITTHPGAIKKAHGTKDDYLLPEPITEQIT